MESPPSTTLLQLWELAGGNLYDAHSEWKTTFEPIGLILFAPLRHGGYRSSPVNSLAFGSTGGDGVHYSLLQTGNGYTDFSPVIMTVPMSYTPNVVVGANLRDFLALGCRFGYFRLEQLVYAPSESIAALSAGRFHDEDGQEQRTLLNRISTRFGVVPWTNPESRLAELREMHHNSLVLPPQDGQVT